MQIRVDDQVVFEVIYLRGHPDKVQGALGRIQLSAVILREGSRHGSSSGLLRQGRCMFSDRR